MYISEVLPQLIASLAALCSPGTTVLVAHGRNRPAEPEFKAAAQQHFSIELVPSSELDPVYQVGGGVCPDKSWGVVLGVQSDTLCV